jgi:hypothetical protein
VVESSKALSAPQADGFVYSVLRARVVMSTVFHACMALCGSVAQLARPTLQFATLMTVDKEVVRKLDQAHGGLSNVGTD